ncbi:DNA-methyltransferase [Haloterrigena salifodinae]|uniref:DNA-methyltransferase n=1 Tax=Haloterrigena salifodinae TaxID=2675099 RepID=UPI000F862B91|nr:site-specific DNA-methyltransferase [Haloterrigena salifodinae]
MSEDTAVTKLLSSEAEYNTELGAAYQGDSRELLEELPDNSIDLIVTSPPFALQHQKEYGNEDQQGYNDWFMSFIPEIRRVLQPHGSFVVEIGGAFKRGYPERSTYQFELLNRLVDEDEGQMRLAQDFYWYNPAKLPSPIEWVNVRKIRVTDAVTHIWWLTPEINKDSAVEEGEHPHPEVSNQRVLQEYSDSQKELIETGEFNDGERGSGWNIDSESFANDNDGSIPDNFIEGHEAGPILDRLDEVSAEEFISWITDGESIEDLSAGELCRILGMGDTTPDNVIEASNTASNTHYLQMCREFDVDSHPARFPRQIPEFFIDFLTPNPPYDDWDRSYLDKPIVLDIFGGSNLTGLTAEKKGRHWLAFEREQKYIDSSQFRFLTEEEIRKSMSEDQSDLGDFPAISKND